MSLMRIAGLALVAIVANGCVAQPGGRPGLYAADPLINGPFLIGAERPSVGTHCLRPADVRSQDARGIWRPCPTENLAEQVAAADTGFHALPPPPPGGIIVPVQPPEHLVVPVPSSGRLPSRPRSAWDG